MAADLCPDEILELSGQRLVGKFARSPYDHGSHYRPAPLVGLCHRTCFHHERMREEGVFDLCGAHVVARGDDDVVGASAERPSA